MTRFCFEELQTRRWWVSALGVRCVGLPGPTTVHIHGGSGWVADHWLINIGSLVHVECCQLDAPPTHSPATNISCALTSRFLGTTRFLTHLLQLHMDIKHVTGKECPRSKSFQKRSSRANVTSPMGAVLPICVSVPLSPMSPQERGELAQIQSSKAINTLENMIMRLK